MKSPIRPILRPPVPPHPNTVDVITVVAIIESKHNLYVMKYVSIEIDIDVCTFTTYLGSRYSHSFVQIQ